jgi:CNT family concentrative nucleoside transporter
MGHQSIVRRFVLGFIPTVHHFPSSAWFFFKIMNVSGAEAVVASASPWIGQGESACLVKPYIDLMTPSELHLTMTSGLSVLSLSI